MLYTRILYLYYNPYTVIYIIPLIIIYIVVTTIESLDICINFMLLFG